MEKQSAATGQRSQSGRAKGKGAIPLEFAPLIDAFAQDSHQRIELWCYALVLLMIDEEQARQVGAHEVAGRWWVTLQIASGEEFDIVKPQLNEATEQKLLEGVREIVEQHTKPRKRRSN